ncbi:MAG TPA: hypothetical protein VF178_05925 [Gemmatimonadaceae bacterium]
MNRRPRKPYTKLPASVKDDLGAVLRHLTERDNFIRAAGELQCCDYEACFIQKGKLTVFSAERLLVFLTRLGCDLEIRILPRRYHWAPGPFGREVMRPAPGAVKVVDLTATPIPLGTPRRAVDGRRANPQFQGSRSP